MTQSVQTQAPTSMFNQASLDGASDRLQELKLEEGKSTLVSFIENIPGMPNPPFVYAKVHWNSEMGDNGRMYQCFGGSCCQQVTWQKGWGGAPGKFEAHKAKTRYFIPVVHYEQDPQNPISVKATIKYLNITWSAYNVIVNTMKNVTGQLSFFMRDAKLEAQKINGALVYQVYLTDTQAQWMSQPAFTQQVNEQLPDVAAKLLAAMPKLMTEAEFMEMKPELDKKVALAMNSYNQQNEQSAQAGFGASSQAGLSTIPQQSGFNPIPQQVQPGAFNPVPGQSQFAPQTQTVYTQPQVNIPFQPQVPQTTGVEGVPQTVGIDVPTQQVPTQVVTQTAGSTQTVEATTQAQPFEIPAASLEFDPSTLLK